MERVYGESTGGKPGFAFGVVDADGVLRGAFVILLEHNRTAELSVFGRTSNDTVRAMFRAVFGTLGIYRLQIRTHKQNRVVKKAAVKFGFRFEGVQKHFYGPGVDALSYYMTPETCRWLSNEQSLQIA